mmetsp:Transcript_19885/g.58700  ORF Transcript_19885/g.58700 Transcript_19885/m.58700 type:complete len:244 (-) Transcript_19885:273-1004(-)
MRVHVSMCHASAMPDKRRSMNGPCLLRGWRRTRSGPPAPAAACSSRAATVRATALRIASDDLLHEIGPALDARLVRVEHLPEPKLLCTLPRRLTDANGHCGGPRAPHPGVHRGRGGEGGELCALRLLDHLLRPRGWLGGVDVCAHNLETARPQSVRHRGGRAGGSGVEYRVRLRPPLRQLLREALARRDLRLEVDLQLPFAQDFGRARAHRRDGQVWSLGLSPGFDDHATCFGGCDDHPLPAP